MSPDTYVGLVAVGPFIGLLAFAVAKAAREDVRSTGSTSRAFWHPGVLFLVAVVAFVAACFWVVYSFTVGSAVLFLASSILAACSGLTLELRRGRPGLGVVAFLGVGVCWFFGAGFFFLMAAIGAHG